MVSWRMFSALILVCSIDAAVCGTVAAPVFVSLAQCQAETNAHVARLAPLLPPEQVIVSWACHQWAVSA